MLADAGVGAEQEADKRISNAKNIRCGCSGYRFTIYIVSENILINSSCHPHILITLCHPGGAFYATEGSPPLRGGILRYVQDDIPRIGSNLG
jgi:hypothetical protein